MLDPERPLGRVYGNPIEMNEESPAISIRLQDAQKLRSYSCQAMACTFNFHLMGSSPGLVDSAIMEAEERLARLEAQLSFYIEYSDISRINRANAGETIRISEETVECLLQAFDASARLGGKFHPFLGVPSTEQKGQRSELPHLVERLDDDSNESGPVVSLDQNTNTVRKLRIGSLLDLGGIGKGFALDQLRSLFNEWEIEQGLLECGGSTFLAMRPPEEAIAWELSIGYGNFSEKTHLTDGRALASSGVAFQGSHVVDPETKSADFNWKRSYAEAPSAALADAASTAALLMNSESLDSVSQQDNDLSFKLYSDASEFQCGPKFERMTGQ